jgi:hypothetical protein
MLIELDEFAQRIIDGDNTQGHDSLNKNGKNSEVIRSNLFWFCFNFQ